MANKCGKAHGILDGLFGCDKCKKIEKLAKKKNAAQRAADINNDRIPGFEGWRIPDNWSRRQREQFPFGVPPEDY